LEGSIKLLKILHVIPGISVRFGGPSKAVFEMCQALREIGVEADIATTDADINSNLQEIVLGKPVEIEGVTVYCFRCRWLRKYGFSFGLTAWLKQNVKRYDVVHSHAVFSYITGPLAYYARKNNVPYVIRPIGQLNSSCLRKNVLIKSFYLAVLGKRCLNNARLLHLTSEDEKVSAQRLNLTVPGAIIPLGMHVPEDSALPARGGFRKLYPDFTNKKLIVFLSRLDPIKGLDLLLPALASVSKGRDDFFAVIAGSGDGVYDAAVRRLASRHKLEKKIIFPGFLQGYDKWSLLRDADIFTLPSYNENFGIAVVEAMAIGVPVVISNQVGIHREVTQYAAGIATSCDSGEIATALMTLLDDELLRHRMGENGKRLVKERFTWEKIGADLREVYEAIQNRS
jgi:glycosyltransferase involved in cell wall biosynthesis